VPALRNAGLAFFNSTDTFMRLYYNADIYTLNPAQPRADALLVHQGQILDIGYLTRMSVPIEAEKIDLKGKFVFPGFIDAHIHIWKVGDLLTNMLDLRMVKSIAEMQDSLADFARRNPNNAWILARGFNEARFTDARMPLREDLDQAVSNRPVQVIRTCAHIAVLNTKALEMSGISAQTPIPAGGEIRRDESGQPNGILTETALGLPKKFIPPYTAADYRRMVLAAQEALLRCGITTATDPAVHPELLEVYRQMEQAGELRLRIHAIPIRIPDGDAAALPLPERYASDWLHIDTVKFFADGGLSGQTAALRQPYRGSTQSGVLRLEDTFFWENALEAQTAGWRIATHAIGDRAIEQVLDIYQNLEKTNHAGLRHRIEHLGLPDTKQLTKMSRLGIHCVTQPVFLWELGANFRQALGETYLNQTYPYRAVLDAGINLAFSSDAPVVRDFNPLMGIRNAVERKDANGYFIGENQRISIQEALSAYTTGAAAANGDSDKVGSLMHGKMADFVVLDQNPLSCTPAQCSDIRVLHTAVGGAYVFSAEF
jgi:predicted amidohydrolase YtcJ